MRPVLLLTAALLASCSQNEPQKREAEDLKTYDAEESPAVRGPGVDVTAAPGVAFNYRYAFQLPSERIAAAQEAHASACEKLGIDRCRITGMRYRLLGGKNVEAFLSLRLDPTVARAFGKQATDVVVKAEGMLTDQEISGEDVGSRIAANSRSAAELRQELAAIERRLGAKSPQSEPSGQPVTPPPPPTSGTVSDQESRANEIRDQLRSIEAARTTDQEALSGTPMVFRYGSGDMVPDLDTRSPVRSALHAGAQNFSTMFSFLLMIVAVVLPWALLLGLGLWLFTKARRRFGWSTAKPYRATETVSDRPADQNER